MENLKGITSTVKSDHILNLFQEVDGTLPRDMDAICAPIKKFLTMDPEQKMIYRVGRRTGIFSKLGDLNNSGLLAHAEAARKRYGVTVDNIDEFIETIIKQFI